MGFDPNAVSGTQAAGAAGQIGMGVAGGAALGPVGMVIGGLGGAISAYGSLKGAQAISRAAQYKAQVARNNAAIARQNAGWASEFGEIKSTQEGMKTRAQIGATKARQAASGVDVNSGSAADVQGAEAQLGMMDALTIRSNAAREAYGYQTKAQNLESEAGLDVAEGGQAEKAGWISGLGTLLSTASSVGGNYARWQNVAPSPTNPTDVGSATSYPA